MKNVEKNWKAPVLVHKIIDKLRKNPLNYPK